MDVGNGYLARRRKSNPTVAAIRQGSRWTVSSLETEPDAGFQQSSPDDRARAEEKFGVYRETLFDFRDYGLD